MYMYDCLSVLFFMFISTIRLKKYKQICYSSEMIEHNSAFAELNIDNNDNENKRLNF